MDRCAVLNVPGLSAAFVAAGMPHLQKFAAGGRMAPLHTILPAANCAVEATFLTGAYPSEHGVVGDGWYYRDLGEVRFWPQSDRLVQRPQIWETARRLNPDFTCAKLCWFTNMYSTADYAVTPQPVFPADGRVLPGLFTEPMSLRRPMLDALGQFPIYNFWGPTAGIQSSQWIAHAAMWMERQKQPTLSLVFLPHLDYAPHKLGPDPAKVAASLREIDAVCGELIEFYEARGVRVLVVSEYGIVPVSRPVHLNRRFRERGWIAVREELGREVLYPGSCQVFAAADLQVAHVYVRNPALRREVQALLEAEPGVAAVLDDGGKRQHHLDNPRSGELVAVAEPDAWFTYYYWLDDQLAPDYARTVDIFRKPGYDPLELFVDAEIPLLALKYGWSLLKDKCGVRTLLDFIPLDGALLKGAHGALTDAAHGPVVLTRQAELVAPEGIGATGVHDLMLAHMSLKAAAA
jgi:predicted AlkP superfamily pyrophosphatase or phosphodiesterase